MAKELLEAIPVEIDESDYVDEYNDYLNESYGEFMDMTASYILSECDPIAYSCGLSDFADAYGSEKFKCPICEEVYDDEDDAKYCCQTDDEEDEDE